MKVDILCVSRRFRPFEEEWVGQYLSRIRPFADLSLIRSKTWKELKEKIDDRSYVILLDPKGKLFTTSQFAELFSRAEKQITFVLGGSYGLSSDAKDSADLLLSLSSLTFPHRLATLVLVEQIYRALSWRAGSPYHHE